MGVDMRKSAISELVSSPVGLKMFSITEKGQFRRSQSLMFIK